MGNQGSDDELRIRRRDGDGMVPSARLQKRHKRPRRDPYDLRLREVPALEDGGERGTTLAVCFVARESPLRDGWPHPRAAGAELRIKHLPRP